MHVRLLVHLLWVAWFTALFFLAHAADGRNIRMTHTYIGRAAIVLMVAWFVLLASTVRGAELLPRAAIVPVLAALELGGGVLAWTWLVWCGSDNFRLEFKRDSRTSALLIAVLTLLFAGCRADLHVETTPPTPVAIVQPASPLMQLPGVPPGTVNGMPLPGTHGQP